MMWHLFLNRSFSISGKGFVVRMPFMSPNNQCQSTERNLEQ